MQKKYNLIPLIDWYRAHQRPLPWRSSPTPYHVWISEIMLQQTRIEAVIPYYERFLAALPDVRALAEVDDERLMKLWEGLGYYSRARNLKKAAALLCNHYDGTLPADFEELRSLPGIGDYTAGAIASIAYGLPEPAVDGNVLRVYARLTACPDDVMSVKTRKAVTAALRELYPRGGNAGLLTQGLMELGENICIPNGEPRCKECPLNSQCQAYRTNTASQYPVRAPKKARRIEERTVFILRYAGKIAMRKRPAHGLLADLWELPALDGMADIDTIEAWLAACETSIETIKPCGQAKHIFTHVEWHMTGYDITCTTESPAFVWMDKDALAACASPTAFKFYRAQF